MPNWGEVLNEIEGAQDILDATRRKYLKIMNQYTGRNVIAYYSGYLQKPRESVSIDDNDKNAFMQAVYGLDKSKGLDLILHTPGGNIAATESIVEYLKSIFGDDIRAFIPQIALSAGTMIALAAKEIIMGKQSSIGPIDPRYGGISCEGVLEEFEKALESIKNDPTSVGLWSLIIGKYHPTFLGDCEKAIDWSNNTVKEWLRSNMLKNETNPEECANRIVERLGSHKKTYAHAKHIHIKECKELGIVVTPLEGLDQRKIDGCEDLQDCVLTIHHTYMLTFSRSSAVKIVENHLGNAMKILRDEPSDR